MPIRFLSFPSIWARGLVIYPIIFLVEKNAKQFVRIREISGKTNLKKISSFKNHCNPCNPLQNNTVDIETSVLFIDSVNHKSQIFKD